MTRNEFLEVAKRWDAVGDSYEVRLFVRGGNHLPCGPWQWAGDTIVMLHPYNQATVFVPVAEIVAAQRVA